MHYLIKNQMQPIRRQSPSERAIRDTLGLGPDDPLRPALAQWYWNGESPIDLIMCIGRCELCKHPQLRFQFTIIHINQDGRTMLVGSKCIKKFDIRGVVMGKQLLSLDRDQQLDRYIKEACEAANKQFKEALKNTCRNYYKEQIENGNITSTKAFILRSAIQQFLNKDKFSPNNAVTIIKNIDESEIQNRKSIFKIDMKTKECKRQLKQMNQSNFQLLLPFLKKSQIPHKCESTIVEEIQYSTIID